MNPPLSSTFAPDSPYRRLAKSLDSLPNRFPPAQDDSDLRLLARLFTPEQAGLAAELQPELETPAQISQRSGRDLHNIAALLKEMSQKGLVASGKTEQGRFGFGLLPFVVGIYENQNERMDVEMAHLFEDYFMHAFGGSLEIKPQVHRVIPVHESISNTMEIQPFESVSNLIDRSQAWGVIDCICRKQKALIGQACKHPVDVCLIFAGTPDAFAGSTTVRPLTRQGAYQTLRRAAQAGLVHCVSNNQNNVWYICNCCTCSCGVLRGMADLGIANVVARSSFVNRVDEDLCIGCGECLDACQFNALSVDSVAQVQEIRCAGCGVCVQFCQQGALRLEHRPGESAPPASEEDWRSARQATFPG
jgi:Na+-translocating ferredoxin:NAD+ oxidoreductase subunit B